MSRYRTGLGRIFVPRPAAVAPFCRALGSLGPSSKMPSAINYLARGHRVINFYSRTTFECHEAFLIQAMGYQAHVSKTSGCCQSLYPGLGVLSREPLRIVAEPKVVLADGVAEGQMQRRDLARSHLCRGQLSSGEKHIPVPSYAHARRS